MSYDPPYILGRTKTRRRKTHGGGDVNLNQNRDTENLKRSNISFHAFLFLSSSIVPARQLVARSSIILNIFARESSVVAVQSSARREICLPRYRGLPLLVRFTRREREKLFPLAASPWSRSCRRVSELIGDPARLAQTIESRERILSIVTR